jgi:hypothetical protein
MQITTAKPRGTNPDDNPVPGKDRIVDVFDLNRPAELSVDGGAHRHSLAFAAQDRDRQMSKV